MFKRLLAALLILVASAAAFAEEDDRAIHEELRGVLGGMQQAINAEKYDDLAPYFHENLRVTTINQEVISSRPEIARYFQKWFGPGGYLKKLKIALNADALTELYSDKTMGTVRGSGDEDYVLSDGRFFAMKTRWTATVIKDSDGKWRILTLHIGTNFLDNPILAKAEASLGYAGVAGGAAGLALGVVIGWLIWRRKRRA